MTRSFGKAPKPEWDPVMRDFIVTVHVPKGQGEYGGRRYECDYTTTDSIAAIELAISWIKENRSDRVTEIRKIVVTEIPR